jgi:hypothetical protein
MEKCHLGLTFFLTGICRPFGVRDVNLSLFIVRVDSWLENVLAWTRGETYRCVYALCMLLTWVACAFALWLVHASTCLAPSRSRSRSRSSPGSVLSSKDPLPCSVIVAHLPPSTCTLNLEVYSTWSLGAKRTVSICVCMYVCMYVCTLSYMYAHKYLHVHTDRHTYMYTYTHIWPNQKLWRETPKQVLLSTETMFTWIHIYHTQAANRTSHDRQTASCRSVCMHDSCASRADNLNNIYKHAYIYTNAHQSFYLLTYLLTHTHTHTQRHTHTSYRGRWNRRPDTRALNHSARGLERKYRSIVHRRPGAVYRVPGKRHIRAVCRGRGTHSPGQWRDKRLCVVLDAPLCIAKRCVGQRYSKRRDGLDV